MADRSLSCQNSYQNIKSTKNNIFNWKFIFYSRRLQTNERCQLAWKPHQVVCHRDPARSTGESVVKHFYDKYRLSGSSGSLTTKRLTQL